ncbi:MAG TPA: hypothetical protein VGG34_09595 [Opitutaceae bacterium]
MALSGLIAAIGLLASTLGRAKSQVRAVAAGSFHEVPGRTALAWATDGGRVSGAGSLRVGPFPSPYALDFWVAGSPGAPGNDVHFEIDGLNIRLPVDLGGPGHAPRKVHVEFPLGWRGWGAVLVASCRSDGPGSGFEISNFRPSGPSDGPFQAALSWVAVLILYGLGVVVISDGLGRSRLPACWAPLAAVGILAAAGYIAFWVYFLSPSAGKALSWLCLALLAWGWLSRKRGGTFPKEYGGPLVLVALSGAFLLGILYLFHSQMAYYQLAAERFISGQPGDDRLTFDFANLLYHGLHPKELGAGWLSSDRPPLQEGWQLLAWPISGALGLSDIASSGASALFFQLAWIFALYGLLRTIGLSPRRALAWTAAAVPLGFFVMNSLYTWPKLSAGAFACGAFGISIMGAQRPPARWVAAAGLFAALACLSHGGAAFSLLGAAPWVAWMAMKGQARAWALAAAVFILMVGPWIAYQKLFAPPGDRLLKWHLAGHTEIDGRTLAEDLADAYGRLSPSEIAARKLGNLGFQFGGDWRAAVGSPGSAEDRRADEAHRFVRSLEWFGLGALVALMFSFLPGCRRRLAALGPGFRRLSAWTLATILVWCGLLYAWPILPHGSYAMVIAAVALCAAVMEAADARILAFIALAEVTMCATTWMPSRDSAAGAVSGWALAVIVASLLAGLGLAWPGRRTRAPGA